MRVIVEATDAESMVRLRTAAGTAPFTLSTPRGELVAGSSCSAELEIREALVDGQNVRRTSETAYRIASGDGLTTLVGWVDTVDDDGVLYFRLGADSLTMLEPIPGHRVAGEWLEITLPSERISVYLS